MKNYVLGFMFSADFKHVVLIRKNRPEWQAGKLNAVGGHIEPSDNSSNWAMSREFKEETGIETNHLQWQFFANLEFPAGNIECFATTGDVLEAKTMTDETIVVATIYPHSEHRIENLEYLIPMAKNCLTTERPFFADITEV